MPSTAIPSRRWSSRTRPRLDAPPRRSCCASSCAAVRRAPQRGPGGGADDAVGGEPVAALEALDGALGAAAEDPVGADARASAGPCATRGPLEPFLSGFAAACAGQGRTSRCRDAPAVASAATSASMAHLRPCSSGVAKSVRFPRCASVVRLRGELTGSRCVRYTTKTAAIRPCGPRRTAPVPPFATARGGGDSAAVVLPPKLLRLQDFLHPAGVEPAVARPEPEQLADSAGRRAATRNRHPAAVAELVDARASGARELYARGGSSPLSRIRSLPSANGSCRYRLGD